MNESTPENDFESSEAISAFLPLTLIGISVALVLAFQLTVQFPQRTILQKVVAQNEQAVQQSRQIQGGLQTLILDLNTAAPEETRAALAKRGLQLGSVTGPATAAPSAAPAPSASPAGIQ